MTIQSIHISGFRSMRSFRVDLEQLNVVVGALGSGKNNLFKGLMFLNAAARGDLLNWVLREGGMPSMMWAGEPKRGRARVRVGVMLHDLAFELSLALASASPSAFSFDPIVRSERLSAHVSGLMGGKAGAKVVLAERKQGNLWISDATGHRVTHPEVLNTSESMLSQLIDPGRFPELQRVSAEILGWRFYGHFHTGHGAPMRAPQPGARTPVLSADGRDLAAALQTIREFGDRDALDRAISRAFPGSRIEVIAAKGRFTLRLHVEGMNRPFDAHELSGGVIRYLCLLAALMSPEPPSLLAFEEPETSIHPDLLSPLAEHIVEASKHTQIAVATHSRELANLLQELGGVEPVELLSVEGETKVAPDNDWFI